MHVAVDIIIQRGDQFLFIRRKSPPFEGELALPGGFVELNETVEDAACRELREETNVTVSPDKLRLVGVFSAPRRDPRSRVISIAFHAVVPPSTFAIAGDDAERTLWLSKDEIQSRRDELAFDHAAIMRAL